MFVSRSSDGNIMSTVVPIDNLIYLHTYRYFLDGKYASNGLLQYSWQKGGNFFLQFFPDFVSR